MSRCATGLITATPTAGCAAAADCGFADHPEMGGVALSTRTALGLFLQMCQISPFPGLDVSAGRQTGSGHQEAS